MVKSIVLIGDEANAKGFINELQKNRSTEQASNYLINNYSIQLQYQPNVDKAVTTNCSGIVVINANNGHIPDSVVAYLPRLPSDQVYYYSKDKNPEAFLKSFVGKLKSIETFKAKLKFFLFGAEPETRGSKHLQMEIGRKKVVV